jgi:hypothetical protein
MENTTQITIADLDALRGIVDIAAQRGAFRGAELTQVGVVFDKLTSFLNAAVEQAKAAAEAEENSNDAAGAPSDSSQGD